jgi:HPt (histidine-containing phosphotransfer) domain-containing protein
VEILDVAAALERVGGDASVLAALIKLYRADSPGWLADARKARAKGDTARLRLAAHTLYGALGHLGAREAQAAAARLEERARAGDLTTAAPALTDLEQALDRLGPALDALENSTRTGME